VQATNDSHNGLTSLNIPITTYAITTKYSNAAAPGQTLVKTNKGVECSASMGCDGPKVWVMVRATSREIYVVAAKNARVRKVNG
jgi:hypothetical protein